MASDVYFDELIDYEERLARMYDLMSRRYPDHEVLYRGMRREEMEHRKILAEIKGDPAAREVVRGQYNRHHHKLIAANEEAEALLAEMRGDNLPEEEARRRAIRIELGSAELQINIIVVDHRREEPFSHYLEIIEGQVYHDEFLTG